MNEAASNPVRLVLVTGVSGSGKTTALRALEDLGYFSIDNLPIVLLPRLLELGTRTTDEVTKIALVTDAREGGFLEDVPAQVAAARKAGHDVQVVFLDARDEELLRRFSETRRRHPLSEGNVEAGIAAERAVLNDLRHMADTVIDTTALNVHDLKRLFQDRFGGADRQGPAITVLSFGFKNGLPPQADLVLDCRFLPNPHFIDHLRPKTGLDREVADYVLDREETRQFVAHVEGLLDWLVPQYQRERKAYLTVAIGCTGGRHRSVALAEHFGRHLREAGQEVLVRHRDASPPAATRG